MAKLNKADAKRVAENVDEGFTILDDGMYLCRLDKVEVSEKPGGSGFHYWSWILEVAQEEGKGRKLWHVTSLSPKADFAMANTFAAFDYTTDTDTDEICGQLVMAIVGHRIIDQGPRTGQLANTVESLLRYDPSTNSAVGADGEDVF
jgi:hypothetical protein